MTASPGTDLIRALIDTLDANVVRVLDLASREDWTTDRLVSAVKALPEYRASFPALTSSPEPSPDVRSWRGRLRCWLVARLGGYCDD